MNNNRENINMTELAFWISSSVEGCIEFCQEKGLLRKTLYCKKCRIKCIWTARRKVIDKYCWRCQKCKCYYSIRAGSFFGRSKLDLQQVIKILYLWSFDMSSYSTIERECRIYSAHTVSDWKNFIRNVCCEYFLNNPRKIGGPEHTIDATVFNRKKYNVGSATVMLWVFMGYDPTDNEGFMVGVPDKKPETLIPLIKTFILPGTTIISDCWKAYSNLEKEGFYQLMETHSYDFVDLKAKHVERMWTEAKRRNRYESSDDQVSTHFQEYMWRQKFGQANPFSTILSQISLLYPFNQQENEVKKAETSLSSLPPSSSKSTMTDLSLCMPSTSSSASNFSSNSSSPPKKRKKKDLIFI